MSTEIRIGIIGCGRIAELVYLPVLIRTADVRINALLDPREDRMDLIAAGLLNCGKYRTLNDKFIGQIDAAVISSPPDSHLQLAAELLRNNKHVLIEKPLATSMKGIDEFLQLAGQSNGMLMMGFNHRYWHPAVRMRDVLRNNAESLHSAEIIFSSDYSKWNPVSFQSDALDDLAPHVFDLIRFVFNSEILTVSAHMAESSLYNIKIKIKDNAVISASVAHSDKSRKKIIINTDKNSYYLTAGSDRIQPLYGLLRRYYDYAGLFKRKLTAKTSPLKLSYKTQMDSFINSIKLNQPVQPGLADGIASVMAVEAVRKSIKENGKEINLNEIR